MRGGLFLAILAICGPVLKARQLPIKTYSTAEGLARNNVKKILRDSRGFLWFATSEGISRFDGYAFTNYGVEDGLPQRNVNDVIETRDGERWFATSGGFCRLRVSGAPGKSGSKFSVYRPSRSGAAEFANVLLEDHTGAIWCGTRGGVFRLAPDKDPATLRFVDAGIPRAVWGDAVVRALWEDRLQRLWIGTEAGLYLRHSDGHMDQYTMQDGLPSDLVYAVLEDSVGRIWAGTEAGLCQLANKPGRGKPVTAAIYTSRHGLPNNSVQCLLETSDHKLWVGTRGGLSEFTAPSGPGQPLIQSYTSANGLSDRDI